MLAGIDYAKLATIDDPEEVRRMVLPRVYELLLAGGLDPIDETEIYPDGTVMIMMRKICNGIRYSLNPIYITKDGQILTKKPIGTALVGEGLLINFCYHSESGCHRGCGCKCLLDLGYIEWKRYPKKEYPHKRCNGHSD